ncbi:hypothetical protein [Paenibacillus xylanexedens]|uniref:hypothetical protein n=1 Tax=Paenibacillus xylanexedens TaxID=528191 RepID=UPI0011AB15E7|nr:hypothetical protein [Paenibacillus xylanexedens]
MDRSREDGPTQEQRLYLFKQVEAASHPLSGSLKCTRELHRRIRPRFYSLNRGKRQDRWRRLVPVTEPPEGSFLLFKRWNEPSRVGPRLTPLQLRAAGAFFV